MILINLNDGRVYITRSVLTRFFPMDPDNRVIVESQCTCNLHVTLPAIYVILKYF